MPWYISLASRLEVLLTGSCMLVFLCRGYFVCACAIFPNAIPFQERKSATEGTEGNDKLDPRFHVPLNMAVHFSPLPLVPCVLNSHVIA